MPSARGSFSGTANIRIVEPPISGEIVVDRLVFFNRDTATVTLTIEIVEDDEAFELHSAQIGASKSLIWDDPIRLTASEYVQARLAASVSTKEPHWYSGWEAV